MKSSAVKSEFKSKIPWREKIENVKEHKIVTIPSRMEKRMGKGTMLIPKPSDIEALIRKVRKGKLVTKSELRRKLSGVYKTDVACPITTGIFIRIIAEASEDDIKAGRKSTPYWRIVNDDGSLTKTFPGGEGRQAANLRREGMRIGKSKNGKEFIVRDFENFLVRL